jgi:hypothetical protein
MKKGTVSRQDAKDAKFSESLILPLRALRLSLRLIRLSQKRLG